MPKYCRRPNYELTFARPPRLDDWMPQDHPVRFVRDVVDSIGLQALGFEDRAVERGRAPLSTDLRVKAWLYGFVERFRSTRRLEWACSNVPAAIWLTGNERPRARQPQDPEAAALLARRKVILEPVFAQRKWNDGFRRFTVRGLDKVHAQWALLCTALNLRKLYKHWVAAGCRLATA